MEPHKQGKRGQGRGMKLILDNIAYDGDECLIWPMSRDTSGYGQFCHLRQQLSAHRKMCEMVNGPAPTPEHEAAHSCGNGHNGCFHPKHLDWETRADNQRDRRKHGTERKKGVPRFKLTEDAVAQIRAAKGKATHAALGKRFGVSRDTIGKVLAGKTWIDGKRYVGGFRNHPWTAERRAEYAR